MTYPGGKAGAGVYQTIINQIPPHEVYIEPFMGGGAIMRRKRPAAVNIGVDRSAAAIAAFDGAAVPHRLIHGCGLAFLESYRWTGREFVYADPPYMRAVRRSPRPIYQYEMSDVDHRRLLAVLERIPAAVMVSGYWSEVYGRALAGWRLVEFQATTRGGVATECLWMNYAEPVALHDYSFLGTNYRDRERIKRKASRWAARFAALPELERRGILSAVLAMTESGTVTAGDAAGAGFDCGIPPRQSCGWWPAPPGKSILRTGSREPCNERRPAAGP